MSDKITLPVSRATILDTLARIMRDRAYPEFVHAPPPLWATDAAEQIWTYIEDLTKLALRPTPTSAEPPLDEDADG